MLTFTPREVPLKLMCNFKMFLNKKTTTKKQKQKHETKQKKKQCQFIYAVNFSNSSFMKKDESNVTKLESAICHLKKNF